MSLRPVELRYVAVPGTDLRWRDRETHRSPVACHYLASPLVIGPLVRTRFLRKVGHWLVKPVVAWLAMNVTLLAWHVPRAYDFALEHEFWHGIEHLCFLSTSLLFWWCILRPWPAAEHRRNWGILIYLVSADIVNTLLSAFLAFCGKPVYQFYLDSPNPFHVSPLEDQVLGAVIMWVIGSLAFLIPGMLITVHLLRPSGITHRLASVSLKSEA